MATKAAVAAHSLMDENFNCTTIVALFQHFPPRAPPPPQLLVRLFQLLTVREGMSRGFSSQDERTLCLLRNIYISTVNISFTVRRLPKCCAVGFLRLCVFATFSVVCCTLGCTTEEATALTASQPKSPCGERRNDCTGQQAKYNDIFLLSVPPIQKMQV